MALLKKEPSRKERFARIVKGEIRDGQFLIKMDGMPSGPGDEDDLILLMAHFIEVISRSERGGIERFDLFKFGGTVGRLERGGSKAELK